MEQYFSGADKGSWDRRRVPCAKLTRMVRSGAQGRKWGGFPVCNVASEIAIEDRSEKRFAADTSFCVIPSEAKRRDEKSDCHPCTD